MVSKNIFPIVTIVKQIQIAFREYTVEFNEIEKQVLATFIGYGQFF